MAPYEKDWEGFWGRPTSTIDWCEANYEISYYFAEFWNTISNFFMIIPPLIGAVLAKLDGLESRFAQCHLALMVVGIGSWCFHGTLLYEMQLADELPMIWGSAFLIYTLMESEGKPNSENRLLQAILVIYCLTVTVVYLTIKDPIFHEAAYGIMVLTIAGASCKVALSYNHRPWLLIVALSLYAGGFLLWNLDNIFCPKLRHLRKEVGYPLKPVFQGHAWWHVLAGLGTYFGLLFSGLAAFCHASEHR